MQDIKRSKRKTVNQQVSPMINSVEVNRRRKEEKIEEELSRGLGCSSKQNKCECKHDNSCKCGCNNDNNCHHHHNHDCDHDDCHNDNCELESDTCVENQCDEECCNSLRPRLSIKDAAPIAIETNRIFDTMLFQTFTDAVAPNGETLVFDIEVVEVNGSVPRGGQVNVVIDKVCMNFSAVVIDTGTTTLEDFEVEPVEKRVGKSCQTEFEYDVCGRRNATCCSQSRGQSVVYKERGLSVLVEDLVLELRGRCGCTEIVALAFPSVRLMGGQTKRCCDVEFFFNTLTAPICLPADGRGVTLRQDFKTNLTVDCIGKAILRCVCDEDFDSNFELNIPNGIDLIMCLESIVSISMNEQLVVLGSSTPIQPRIVDTFNKVCDFKTCGENNDNNNNHNGCGCKR